MPLKNTPEATAKRSINHIECCKRRCNKQNKIDAPFISCTTRHLFKNFKPVTRSSRDFIGQQDTTIIRIILSNRTLPFCRLHRTQPLSGLNRATGHNHFADFIGQQDTTIIRTLSSNGTLPLSGLHRTTGHNHYSDFIEQQDTTIFRSTFEKLTQCEKMHVALQID